MKETKFEFEQIQNLNEKTKKNEIREKKKTKKMKETKKKRKINEKKKTKKGRSIVARRGARAGPFICVGCAAPASRAAKGDK